MTSPGCAIFWCARWGRVASMWQRRPTPTKPRACSTRAGSTSSSSTTSCRARTASRGWARRGRAGFFADAILITAYADLDTAIQALRAGAVDFVLKPFRSNQILNAVARCLDRVRLQRENYVLRYALRASSDRTFLRENLIGESPAV